MIVAMAPFRARMSPPANENLVVSEPAPADHGEAALRDAVIHWIFAVALLTVVGAVLGASLP